MGKARVLNAELQPTDGSIAMADQDHMPPSAPAPGASDGQTLTDDFQATLQALTRELLVWGDHYPSEALLTWQRGLPVDVPQMRVLRPPEAALYLGLSAKTLWWHRRHRSGPPYVRLGQTALGYRVVDLDQWILARQVEAARPPRRRGRPPKVA
jgi:predicted DNA-binding transcriptional regulator AlpA